MEKKFVFLVMVVSAALLICTAAACAGPVQSEKQLKSANDSLVGILQSKLSNLNNAMRDAAAKIAMSGLQGDDTRTTLNGLCKKYPYLLDCSISDPLGKLITVVPEEYRKLEGTETASTEASRVSMAALAENKTPILSNIFRAVEDADAIVLAWPIVNEKKELVGFINALFKPETLFGEVIAPAAEVRAIKVNVAQTDGMVIYCSNGMETGKSILTDPRYKDYPELLAAGQKVVGQKSGIQSYTYTDDKTGKPVRKTVAWNTIGLHGTEWRVACIAELEANAQPR